MKLSMSNKTAHLIGGIPGAGKSFFGEQLARQLKAAFLDDIRDINLIKKCVDQHDILVITDPFFCEAKQRAKAEATLHEFIPNLNIVWYMFENDIEQCRINVELRNDGRNVKGSLRRFSRNYSIPDGAIILPVWRPNN